VLFAEVDIEMMEVEEVEVVAPSLHPAPLTISYIPQ
jgi:hypothetical protein